MKNFGLTILLCVTSVAAVLAQTTQVYRLNAGTRMGRADWQRIAYRFPFYQKGKITMREGFKLADPVALNLNIYDERLELISTGGDTLRIESATDQIKAVQVEGITFYNNYPRGYVERLTDTPVALGTRVTLVVMFESGTGERFKATDWRLPVSRYDRLYSRKNTYYFIDANENVTAATRPSLLRLFPTHKAQIKQFLRERKTDFAHEQDLLALLDFCMALPSE